MFAGATFEAVEAVAGGVDGARDGSTPSRASASLVDKSLIRQADAQTATPGS